MAGFVCLRGCLGLFVAAVLLAGGGLAPPARAASQEVTCTGTEHVAYLPGLLTTA